MKLLHIIGSMNPTSGGTGEAIRNATAAHRLVGIDTEVVCLDSPAEIFLKKESFPVIALGPSKTGWQYSKLLIPWLENNISRFDVIIVNGLWLYPGYAINKIVQARRKNINKESKIPLVYIMPHGMLDPYFQRAGNRKLKAIRNWIYWQLIESKNVQAAAGLLFTCEEELLLARTTFKRYKPSKEMNVGMGIAAPPVFHKNMLEAFFEKCPAVKNRPYVLLISRINEKKGIDLLIAAYTHIYHTKAGTQPNSTGENTPCLVIAGPGLETEYGNKITQLASGSLAADCIHFTGMLQGDAKWGAFYGCDAFVLPSHQENFGIAVVEAMACSKPVLISNKVNIWREIEANNAGLVMDDTLEGTNALLLKWSNTSLSQKVSMGQRAAACFMACFSITQVAKNFLESIL